MCFLKSLFQNCSSRSSSGKQSLSMSSRSRRPPRYFTNPYVENASRGAAQVNESWLRREASRLIDSITGRHPESDDYHGGAYTGVAGDGYGVFRASRLFPEKTDQFVSFGLRMVEAQLRKSTNRSPAKESQFLLGPLSVLVIRAICMREGKGLRDGEVVDRIDALVDTVLKTGYQPDGDDEMLVGRAGFLAAVLNLRLVLKEEILSDIRLKAIINKVLESGRTYARRHRSPSPLMYQYYGTEYLGAAHGLMGILQMLLSFPNLLDAQAVRDIEASLDWLLSIQTASGNFPTASDEIGYDRGEDELVHWCHGATGAVSLMIVAYLYFRNEKFLQSARRALDLIWRKGVLHKGPGICHGVAGSGYAFLLYYRLTHEQEYLDRARCFAAIFCDESFKARARTPDSPFSLFEGIAGSLCFLCDLAFPEQAQFPLVPIAFDG
uniref:LanC-like protein 3 n=1 Tax=Ascaris suum TaxID=6253 RepID=F1L4V0_ASCSU